MQKSQKSVSFVEMTFNIITHLRDQKNWRAAMFGCATCINTAVTETHTPFPDNYSRSRRFAELRRAEDDLIALRRA